MQTRRGFFGGFFTAVGAISLAGCVEQVDGEWIGIVAPEPVAMRPGLRYANVAPTAVPAVRRLVMGDRPQLDQAL